MKLIIKSVEEIGEEYFVLTIQDEISKEEIFKKLEMASMYTDIYYDDEKYYDEHYSEMSEVRAGVNGQQAFNYYIEEICGWSICGLGHDFEYEW